MRHQNGMSVVGLLVLGFLAGALSTWLFTSYTAPPSNSPVPTPAPTLVPPVRPPCPIPVWPMLLPTIGDQPAPWVWDNAPSPAENDGPGGTIRYVIPLCECNPFGLRHQELLDNFQQI